MISRDLPRLTGNDLEVMHLVWGILPWLVICSLKLRPGSEVLTDISCLSWHYGIFKSPNLSLSVQLLEKSDSTPSNCCLMLGPSWGATVLQLGQSGTVTLQAPPSPGWDRHLLHPTSASLGLTTACHVHHRNSSKGQGSPDF